MTEHGFCPEYEYPIIPKPCPFCGEVLHESKRTLPFKCYIHNVKNDCILGRYVMTLTGEEEIKMWNRRVDK